MTSKKAKPDGKNSNRDPLSGEAGAHPVGAGVGAALGAGAGGAALGTASATAGAALGGTFGAAAGPVGVVVGAVAGGLAGALAGKSIAESIDPTAEDAYWRDNFHDRPYVEQGTSYDEYQPAYRYGWESRGRYENEAFEDVEEGLQREWGTATPRARLGWEEARPAVRDAWDRVENARRHSQPEEDNDIVTCLNSLLRGELAATETYQQAMEKIGVDLGATELRQIHVDHREAGNTLRQHVHRFGGKPDQGSGVWGAFAKSVEGAAKLFGNTAALKALKEGEVSGVKSYENALEENVLPNDCKQLIQSTLLPQTRQHIYALDRLMEAT